MFARYTVSLSVFKFTSLLPDYMNTLAFTSDKHKQTALTSTQDMEPCHYDDIYL